MARYTAFQLPGIGLFALLALAARGWLGLSDAVVWAAIGLWVLVDVVMFPFVRSAYEPRTGGGAAALLGASGTAQEALDPSGYVRIAAELWRAELAEGCAPVASGARVRVREVRGLTVVVEPFETPPGGAASQGTASGDRPA